MIQKLDMYSVYCDNCNTLCNDEMVFHCKSTAIEDAQECYWQVVDDKHYCPDCYSWDSDDNLVIDISRTKTERK